MTSGGSILFLHILYMLPPHSLRKKKKNGKKWPLCKKRVRKPGQLLYPTLYLEPKSMFSALAKLWNPYLEHYNNHLGKV